MFLIGFIFMPTTESWKKFQPNEHWLCQSRGGLKHVLVSRLNKDIEHIRLKSFRKGY